MLSPCGKPSRTTSHRSDDFGLTPLSPRASVSLQRVRLRLQIHPLPTRFRCHVCAHFSFPGRWRVRSGLKRCLLFLSCFPKPNPCCPQELWCLSKWCCSSHLLQDPALGDQVGDAETPLLGMPPPRGRGALGLSPAHSGFAGLSTPPWHHSGPQLPACELPRFPVWSPWQQPVC